MWSTRSIIGLVVLLVAAYIRNIYQDSKDGPLSGPIKIFTEHEVIDRELEQFKPVLGEDYDGYRGHIYRVFTYTMHYLGGSSPHEEVIATALVYHDIGLWTDNRLEYIDVSIKRAIDNVGERYSEDEKQLIYDIIYWHHKIFGPFKGLNKEVVNAAINADYIDVFGGLMKFGMPRKHIKAVKAAIPNAGFHLTLVKFGPKLHGWDVIRIAAGLFSIFRTQ